MEVSQNKCKALLKEAEAESKQYSKRQLERDHKERMKAMGSLKSMASYSNIVISGE